MKDMTNGEFFSGVKLAAFLRWMHRTGRRAVPAEHDEVNITVLAYLAAERRNLRRTLRREGLLNHKK